MKDYAIFIFFIGILAVSNLGLAVNVDITEGGVVTDQKCIDDHHLLVTRKSIITEGSSTTNYEINQTIYCEFGCENNRCKLASNELFYVFLILIIGFALSFMTNTLLTKTAGAFIFIILGLTIMEKGLVTTMNILFERIPTITIVAPASKQAFIIFVLLTMVGLGNLLIYWSKRKK